MANKLTIPISFKLKGKTIPVEYDNEFCSQEGYLGEADFSDKLITLCNEFRGKKVKMSEQHRVFYHELMHMMLDACERHNLKYNESFVDDMGLLLYEFERTRK